MTSVPTQRCLLSFGDVSELVGGTPSYSDLCLLDDINALVRAHPWTHMSKSQHADVILRVMSVRASEPIDVGWVWTRRERLLGICWKRLDREDQRDMDRLLERHAARLGAELRSNPWTTQEKGAVVMTQEKGAVMMSWSEVVVGAVRNEVVLAHPATVSLQEYAREIAEMREGRRLTQSR